MLYRRATRTGTSPHLARLADAASLALWMAVLGGGRRIAFV